MRTKITAEYGKMITERLKPDIYVVATLNQAIRSAEGTWVRGDQYRYASAYDQFLKRLAKRVYGNNAYKRHKDKKRVPNAATLEGGHSGMAWHLNICLRCPEWLTFDEYREICLQEWLKIHWAKEDVKFEQLTGGAVPYSLKDGSEALLAESTHF